MSDRAQREAMRQWPMHEEHGEPGFVTCRRGIIEALIDELDRAEDEAFALRGRVAEAERSVVPPRKTRVGVGMPTALWLQEFGSQVWSAFGSPPYHVGSSLTGSTWRDVDVRMILSDVGYEALGLGDPEHPHANEKWIALVLAFSALGRQMTGLPIDFQIQQQTLANRQHAKERSALGIVPLRLRWFGREASS